MCARTAADSRIEDDISDPAQERAKTEGAALAALMRAAVHRYATGHLTSIAEPASQPDSQLTSQPGPASASQATATAITFTGAAEPCPGTVCSGPGCWNRDTARYGLRSLVLCTACAAALQGNVYQRPGADRARIHRGSAA